MIPLTACRAGVEAHRGACWPLIQRLLLLLHLIPLLCLQQGLQVVLIPPLLHLTRRESMHAPSRQLTVDRLTSRLKTVYVAMLLSPMPAVRASSRSEHKTTVRPGSAGILHLFLMARPHSDQEHSKPEVLYLCNP